MRFLFFTLIFLLASINSIAQIELAKISSQNYLQNFVAVSFNDSALVSYEELNPSGIKQKHTTWLRPDGSFREDHIEPHIISIHQHGNGIYYYFLSVTKGKQLLHALVDEPGASVRKTHPIIPVDGKIIGEFRNQNLFLITFHEETNHIKVTELQGLTLISEKKYTLPTSFAKLFQKESDFEFFKKDSPLNTFMGHAKVKVYQYDDLYITVDQPAGDNAKQPSQTQTLIYTLNPENESVESFVIPGEANDNFRSFLFENKLFRNSISNNQFVLNIYDLKSEKLLASEKILKGERKFTVYFRDGQSTVVTQDSFEHAMRVADKCDPSLTVFRSSTGYRIQWGTYYSEKESEMSKSTTTFHQPKDKSGISRYFFYDWTLAPYSFQLNEAPDIVRYSIDKYELEQADLKRLFSFKRYAPFGNGVLGIYYENSIKSASFVKFN